MPPVPVILPSFAAGELDPALHGRVDLAKYQVGLATCLNWFIRPYGGASTRAGTAIVGAIQNIAIRGRITGFQFSQVQTYILEWGDFKLRIIMNGGYVLESALNIAGITLANPGVFNVVAHGYTTGDHVWSSDILGTIQLNRRRLVVTVVDPDHFSIGVDTSSYTAFVSGSVARIYTLTTPYDDVDLALLKFVQSADTLTITHPSYTPYNLTRTGHAAWTITAKTFTPDQVLPTNFASSTPGPVIGYGVTAENDVTGEESRAMFGTSNNETSTITWTAAAGASNYNIYKVRNGIYGFIGRGTAAGGFTDTTITPDFSRTPPQANSPFTGAGNFPGCSTYDSGRQWYARTNAKPQTLFATQSASFNNMDTSQPTQDSDAITRTIASRQVDEIRFLGSLNYLLVFTSGALWKAWSGWQEDVITPANLSVKPVLYEGIAQVPPIMTETSALYVTTSGKRVRDVEIGPDSAQSKNLSILANHLFEGETIEEWAYAKNPDGLVWGVRSDGVLLCFTYLKEHDVYAWSRCVTDGTVESVAVVEESNESILYIIVKRTVGGADTRYVERMPSRFFETVFDEWCLDSAYRYDGWNITGQTLNLSGSSWNQGDAVTLISSTNYFSAASVGLQYIIRRGQDQVTVTITAYTGVPSAVPATLDMAAAPNLRGGVTSDWALARLSLDGMWHLEGETVSVVADGNVLDDITVTQGLATVPQAAGRILAGLPYTCDLETLDIEQGQPTMQGRMKRVSELTIRVKDTRGLSAGPTDDRLTPFKERVSEYYGYPTLRTTGDEKLTIDPSWNTNGRVFIRQDNPTAATVVAIIPKMDLGA